MQMSLQDIQIMHTNAFDLREMITKLQTVYLFRRAGKKGKIGKYICITACEYACNVMSVCVHTSPLGILHARLSMKFVRKPSAAAQFLTFLKINFLFSFILFFCTEFSISLLRCTFLWLSPGEGPSLADFAFYCRQTIKFLIVTHTYIFTHIHTYIYVRLKIYIYL